MKPIILLMLGLIFLMPNVFGATAISGCQDITSSGDYVLTNSIGGDGAGVACIEIDNVDNVNNVDRR